MQGSDVLTALDRLSSISSKADNSAELARLLQDPLFALVSRVTCDPFITFGVKPPQVTSYGWREISGTNDAVFELLKALQVRRLTGAVARSALIAAYAELTPASGEVLRRILARNLGCGLGAASLNNIRPGHVPTFGVMLAGKFEEGILLPHRRYVAEPKRDGMRAICLIEHGRAQFVTRNGRSLPALDSLARDVLATVETSYKRSMMPAIYGDGLAPALVLDGEITSGNLAQTISEVRQRARSSRTAAFEIFDIAPYAAFASEESIAISFADRRHALEQLFSHAAKHDRISLVEQRPVKDVADCYRLRSEWERRGFEGAMIKDLDAPYHKGRSHVWLKLKRHDTEDLTVRDVFEGTGRHAGLLGGVVCNFNGKLLRVSSGFCAAQRRQLWQQREKLIGCVVEVGYQEATAHGALRHPRFIRFRDDKGFAEVAEPAQ